jgi:hypothetical protein
MFAWSKYNCFSMEESMVVRPVAAPCSAGSIRWVTILCIILLAKMTFNHQLKSASRRQMARNFDI